MKENEFQKALALAFKAAEKYPVVTLGIKPEYPATGFGYIEVSQDKLLSESGLNAHAVKAFREKPDLKTAEKFVKEGSFFWNAGIFVFRVSSMVGLFEKHMPDLWSEINKIKKDLFKSKRYLLKFKIGQYRLRHHGEIKRTSLRPL